MHRSAAAAATMTNTGSVNILKRGREGGREGEGESGMRSGESTTEIETNKLVDYSHEGQRNQGNEV